MRKEIWGWGAIGCIFAFWMGGIVYFVLDFRKELLHSLNTLAAVDQLVSDNKRVSDRLVDMSRKLADTSSTIADMSAHVHQIKSLLPVKTVVVNKDGCVRTECLARLLLLFADLRRSFALGVMSHDTIYAVKPMLVALNDQEINNSFKVVEGFNPKRGYRDLKGELKVMRSKLRSRDTDSMLQKRFSKWISVENYNDGIWKEFERLENLVNAENWAEVLKLAGTDALSSIPGMQSWRSDLESVLKIERSLSAIHSKLIERVNKNSEDI